MMKYTRFSVTEHKKKSIKSEIGVESVFATLMARTQFYFVLLIPILIVRGEVRRA